MDKKNSSFLSNSVSQLQSYDNNMNQPNCRKSGSLSAINFQENYLKPNSVKRKRFQAHKERFKKFKRNGSNIISNVPIIGPGAPKPTVITTLPEKTERKHNLSLILVGSEQCGKSSLIERYIQKVFYNETQPTIAPKFYARNIYDSINQTKLRIRLQLWDLPGALIYRPIIKTWCSNTNAAFVLFSLIDETKNSFNEAKDIINIIISKQPDIPIVLIGSKLDILESNDNIERCISLKDINTFITQHKIFYHEISSRTGQGIEELFIKFTQMIKEKLIQDEQIKPPNWISDKVSDKCYKCECSWTVTNRRHHCRNCGLIFCSKCAHKFIPIPRIGKLTPTRVCNDCFDIVMNES